MFFRRSLFFAFLGAFIFAVIIAVNSVGSFAVADNVPVNVTVRVPECNDGIDNDGDSLIDYPTDTGCDDAFDNDETDSVTPACDDNIDNDSDGLTDFPDDPGCDSLTDNNETNQSNVVGGGGGGSGQNLTISGVTFPSGIVTILRDGTAIFTGSARQDGQFDFPVEVSRGGTYTITLMATDPNSHTTRPVSYTVQTFSGVQTSLGGILLPPTIAIDKKQVKKGDSLRVYGYSPIGGDLSLTLLGNNLSTSNFPVSVSNEGRFNYFISTTNLEFGQYNIFATIRLPGKNSDSNVRNFLVGRVNIEEDDATLVCPQKGDLNDDCSVDLVDFSITAYWWDKELSRQFILVEKEKLSGDGILDISDFSLLAYYWTG